jgi:hypothetical protein
METDIVERSRSNSPFADTAELAFVEYQTLVIELPIWGQGDGTGNRSTAPYTIITALKKSGIKFLKTNDAGDPLDDQQKSNWFAQAQCDGASAMAYCS